MSEMTRDPQEYAKRRIAAARPALAWPGDGTDETRAWQKRLRPRLRDLLGGLPAPGGPVAARVLETWEFPEYRREWIAFESRPGLEVVGYFLTPAHAEGRRPALICLPGHGRGADSIVGLGEDGQQREWAQWDEYQADFALQAVAQGYCVFALEQISFGHRRDAQAQALGGATSSCVRDSMAALMLGETMPGWRVGDAIRALDYLATRPEIDADQLGVMGISGGGVTALFTAALDERVRVAVVSGYLNTFRASILAMDHCVDNYVPGLTAVAEMPDIAGLIAPRALFAEQGLGDPIFPVGAFRESATRVAQIYAALDAPEKFGHEIFDGGHQFHGAGAFAFLERELS